jgi:hypothetical protein
MAWSACERAWSRPLRAPSCRGPGGSRRPASPGRGRAPSRASRRWCCCGRTRSPCRRNRRRGSWPRDPPGTPLVYHEAQKRSRTHGRRGRRRPAGAFGYTSASEPRGQGKRCGRRAPSSTSSSAMPRATVPRRPVWRRHWSTVACGSGGTRTCARATPGLGRSRRSSRRRSRSSCSGPRRPSSRGG